LRQRGWVLRGTRFRGTPRCGGGSTGRGGEMGSELSGVLAAIAGAMEQELRAAGFYREAAGKATSAAGKALLNQLADFEQSHFDNLKKLQDSLSGGGGYIEYGGTEFGRPGVGAEARKQAEGNLADVLDILGQAIDAESRAHALYREMAEQTADPKGRAMFLKLAEEETFHRRVLSDQYYQLSNKGGIWFWGD
jgi:rubrerythrin